MVCRADVKGVLMFASPSCWTQLAASWGRLTLDDFSQSLKVAGCEMSGHDCNTTVQQIDGSIEQTFF